MSMFEADPAAKEILKSALFILDEKSTLRMALTKRSKKKRFEDELSAIWHNYHYKRYLQPLSAYPRLQDVRQVTISLQKTILLITRFQRDFPGITSRNRERVQGTIFQLEEILSIFNSSETRTSVTGRKARDPIVNQAVERAITAIEAATGSSLPLAVDYAPGRREREFTTPSTEFLYQLMRGVDENISRAMVATAVRNFERN